LCCDFRGFGSLDTIVTDQLKPYGAAFREPGLSGHQNKAGVSTIGLRIRTSLYEGRRGRCSASGSCEVYRSSPPSMDEFTIISTRNAISTADKITRITEPLHLTSGCKLAPTNAGLSTKPRLVRIGLTAPVKLLVDAAELEDLRAGWVSPVVPADDRRGYDRLYATQFGQADEGCDFSFMLPVVGRAKLKE